MNNIVYIHGANSSARSFRYIQKCLPEHEYLNIEYSVDTPLTSNISTIQDAIQDRFADKKVSIVGHSLGGVIAIGLHNTLEHLSKTITISAPFGGLYYVRLLKYLSRKRTIYDDLVPNAEPLKTIRETFVNVPTLNLITVLGNRPIIFKNNDAIVPVESMKEGEFGDYVQFQEVRCNHSEVLVCFDTVEYIRDFLGLEFAT